MFTQTFPVEVFTAQREFIRVMEANLDFIWWAESLITEETKELAKADAENEGMEQVFKESADLLYVVAGFYNTMPTNPHDLLSQEKNEALQKIHDEAWLTLVNVSNKYRITPEHIVEAFAIVHKSNMSKLDEDGKPIRREDGKILKGPNYVAPDMSSVVKMWQDFTENLEQQEQENAETTE